MINFMEAEAMAVLHGYPQGSFTALSLSKLLINIFD